MKSQRVRIRLGNILRYWQDSLAAIVIAGLGVATLYGLPESFSYRSEVAWALFLLAANTMRALIWVGGSCAETDPRVKER